MRNIAFMLSLALLLSLAHSAGFSACFPYPSAVGFNVENASYSGSYGNYTVYVVAYPPPAIIRVEGPDASQNALVREIALLEQNKMLETPCNITRVQMYSYVNYACSPEGSWQDNDQVHLCGEMEAQNAAAASETAGKGIAPGALDTGTGAAANDAGASGKGNDAAPSASGGSPVAAPTSLGARSFDSASGAAPPSEAAQAIGWETVIPLMGAFLAVVVLSYMLLQQRQVQLEITVDEQRLLANTTRAGIMQELSMAEKIPTDLSHKLGKSKATIVEHLETLVDAGFVEKLATPGKKFVYYRLSHKGKIAVLRKAG